jgi:hypothetical protein
MVFWITFKQMFLFDYWRPGDVKILKSISASHCYEETHFSNLKIEDLFEYLNEKMKNKNFRFMKVSEKMRIKNEKEQSNKNGRIKDKEKSVENRNSLNGTDEHFLSKKEKVDTYTIKLFKLSDMFQYLSVVEISLEECSLVSLRRNDSEECSLTSVNNDYRYEIDSENPIHNSNNYDNKVDGKKDKNIIKSSKTKISFRSVSVSFLPAFFPFGFIFGFLFFLIPFSDFGVNKKYVKELKNNICIDNVINNLPISTSTSTTSSTKAATKKGIDKEIEIKEEIGMNKEQGIEVIETDLQNNNLQPHVPPSTVFFISFIVLPVFLAAALLLFS